MAKTIRLLTLASVVAAQAILAAQGGDADKILAAARQALGGDKKLDAVKSLAIEGRAMRISPAGTSTESDFEVAIELPDKFMRRDVVANMGNMSIYRNSGFNGDGVINEIDAPPQLAGGGGNVVMFRSVGPGRHHDDRRVWRDDHVRRGADARAAGGRAEGDARQRQAGLRAHRARHVRQVAGGLPAHHDVRRAGRIARRQGRRDRGQGRG